MKKRCRRGRIGSDREEERRCFFFGERGIEIEEVERKRGGDNGWRSWKKGTRKDRKVKNGKR